MRCLVSTTVFLTLLLTGPTALATTANLPITQVWQHKDTTMQCLAPGGTSTAHATNHATTPAPGDPHCGYYCAPASISMYALYRGNSAPNTEQDQIYDHGKFSQGDIAGDGMINTHGVGLFDAPGPGGVGGAEVQAAFQWSVSAPYEWGGTSGVPFGGGEIIGLINSGTPILWLDHGGYPGEVNPELPQDWVNVNGHAKVIAGYDDKGTAVYDDDEYYIYDPWPSSGSPYWASWATVVDATDLYITDQLLVPNTGSSVGELKTRY